MENWEKPLYKHKASSHRRDHQQLHQTSHVFSWRQNRESVKSIVAALPNRIWSVVFFLSLVGISWVMPNSVISMLVSLNGMLGSHRYGTGGGGGACLMWGERNCHIFKDKESIVPNLNFLFLKALYEWEWKSSTFSMFSLIEFLDTPLLYCWIYSWFRAFYFQVLFCFGVFSLFWILLVYTFWFNKLQLPIQKSQENTTKTNATSSWDKPAQHNLYQYLKYLLIKGSNWMNQVTQ